MVRNPVVAGQFYPDSPSLLEMQIEGFIDGKVVKEDVIGLLSPHAGYIYSGAVAGAVVERIGYETRVLGLEGSKCKFCGAELNFRNET